MASGSVPLHPTSQTVHSLLAKLKDVDADFRFMSLNDLLQVLTIGRADFLHHDYNVASRTVDGVVTALDDTNGEVQNLAIKWCEQSASMTACRWPLTRLGNQHWSPHQENAFDARRPTHGQTHGVEAPELG